MPNNILITPRSASIQFSGSAANTIRLQVEDSGSVAFYGVSGSLFGITDQLSGSLMSVNDVSGVPILEVFSDDRVVMGTFGRNTLVVSGSTVTVSGSLLLSGSSNISGGSGTGFPFSGSAIITGSLLISGSPSTELTVVGESVFTGSTTILGTSGSANAVLGRSGWTSGSGTTNSSGFANSIDGNASTRWDTGASQAVGQTYVVNFNELLTLNTFVMDTTNSSGDYPTAVSVSSSLDGTTWTPVGIATCATVTTYNFSPPVSARQLRLTLSTVRAALYWSIHEFNISGSRPATGLTVSGSVTFNGIPDTTETNKILVLNSSTGRVFTTASVGGGSGTGFPYSGSAVITGSLLISGSTGPELIVVGDSVFTGSVILSGSAQPELRVIGETSLTGSLLTDADSLVISGSLLTNADTLIFTGSFSTTGSFLVNSDADTLTISGSLFTTADTLIFSGSSYFSGSTNIYGDVYIDGGTY